MNKLFVNQQIIVDKKTYDIQYLKQIELPANATRLVIVSFLPLKSTIPILKIAIQSIQKFTDSPYELWIVDNNSPQENLQWLIETENINIVLNKTQPHSQNLLHDASYSNGVALEIARQLVNQETVHFMALHQDIAVCKYGWLNYLISKFSHTIKAVGVRKDSTRIKDGILHVLGYIVDFQLIIKNNLSFLPKLPEFDTGDLLIVEIKKLGYDIFATPNTLWDSKLETYIPDNSVFKNISIDRSFDDDMQIFFLHLGRGVQKSQQKRKFKTLSVADWEQMMTKVINQDFSKDISNLSQKKTPFYKQILKILGGG